jgi:glycosyltransferase involved in cell wall biosynthesis
MTHPSGLVIAPKFPYPPISGGVKRTLRLLEALDRAGGQVSVLTPDRPPDQHAQALRRRGWSIESAHRSDRRATLVQHVRREPIHAETDLIARARRMAPGATFLQLEHPHLGAVMRAAPDFTWVLSTQNVDSEMGWPEPRSRTELARNMYRRHRLRRMQRLTARRAKAVLCVSDEDAAHFDRYSRRVLVAPNGVDDAFFEVAPELPANEDVLVFGQFSYAPNAEGVQRFFDEGWPRLAAERPRARLLIAGERSRDTIDAGRWERVQVLGVVDDLAATIAAARAILVPVWRGGGTRLKALEAIASARPVASTTLGVRGIGFIDGRHGLIADRPELLAAAMARLLDTPDLSRRVAEEGRRHARPFAWERALRPAADLYRELLEPRPAIARSSWTT